MPQKALSPLWARIFFILSKSSLTLLSAVLETTWL